MVKPDRILKETDANNMDDKINPSGNWVRRLSSLRITLVSQSSSKVTGCMGSFISSLVSTTFTMICMLLSKFSRRVTLKKKVFYPWNSQC